ncbi:hypothetical protein EJB05_52904, partial [Eragrostis curvula]
MIQCTRDISSDDCNLCINSIPEAVPYYCDTKGSRASAGCSARAALFEFYDAQAVQAVMPPPPTPARGTRWRTQSSSPGHSKWNIAKDFQ